MLLETHVTLEATLPLIFNHKTSNSAHKLLEKFVDFQCKKTMIIDYGLTMKPGTKLMIANTEETSFLCQGELKSIERRLQYVDETECLYGG